MFTPEGLARPPSPADASEPQLVGSATVDPDPTRLGRQGVARGLVSGVDLAVVALVGGLGRLRARIALSPQEVSHGITSFE